MRSTTAPDPRFTNFPFGPVPLSPTWIAYKSLGLEEAETLEYDAKNFRFKQDVGKIMPKPQKISSRSQDELQAGPSPPQNASLMSEILPDRLYFMTMPDGPKRCDPKPRSCYYYFTTEKSLRYYPFSRDFGPLNLGQTVKFIRRLHAIITNPDHAKCRIVFYSPNRVDRIANSSVLLSLYLLCVCKMEIPAIEKIFKPLNLKPYRDASYGNCYYQLTLTDILHGMKRAIDLGWFNWETFDLEFYSHHEMIDNGDLNWTIPNKFIAFSSPMMKKIDDEGYLSNTPQDYVPIFKKIGVTDIVRLNDIQYDREIFVNNGFNHHEVTYPDGSIPNEDKIKQFLDIAENSKGVIAVHCKAGLGRTGSMMGIYAIRNFGFTGREWIAWNRICRPGSILGPQQEWLTIYENQFRNTKSSGTDELRHLPSVKSPRGQSGGVRSPTFPGESKVADLSEMPLSTNGPTHRDTVLENVLEEDQRIIAIEGDIGQAERLVEARKKNENVFRMHPSRSFSKSGSTRTRESKSESTPVTPVSESSSIVVEKTPRLSNKLSSFFGVSGSSPSSSPQSRNR